MNQKKTPTLDDLQIQIIQIQSKYVYVLQNLIYFLE